MDTQMSGVQRTAMWRQSEKATIQEDKERDLWAKNKNKAADTLMLEPPAYRTARKLISV
jgi:hypothetical protein